MKYFEVEEKRNGGFSYKLFHTEQDAANYIKEKDNDISTFTIKEIELEDPEPEVDIYFNELELSILENALSHHFNFSKAPIDYKNKVQSLLDKISEKRTRLLGTI